VCCAITGYGQEGPDRDRPGHDIDYLARNGVLALTGERGGAPVAPAVQVADLGGGGLMAAFAVMAALWERERSGEGQVVDVAMTAASQRWLAMVAAGVLAGAPAPRRGELDLAGRLPCYRPYRCADGWVALGALEPKFWAVLCEGLGRPDLLGRRDDETVAPELEAVFAARTRAEWAAFADAHPCCLEPVLEVEEALERMPDSVVSVEQPGAGPVRVLGAPFRMSRTPADDTRPAPALGEHTRAVLAELGYAPGEAAALEAAGAVASCRPAPTGPGGAQGRDER
jgi:crotonobetainyl-CoA:carnitine CoA-transferase CaiB-like acyl-CoA transferase